MTDPFHILMCKDRNLHEGINSFGLLGFVTWSCGAAAGGHLDARAPATACLVGPYGSVVAMNRSG